MNHVTEWEVDERMPRFDDMRLFEVWLRDGSLRTVRRIGNRSQHFTPGLLVFTDCIHPLQQAICDEDLILGWRYCGKLAPVNQDMICPPFDAEYGLFRWLGVSLGLTV